MTEQELTPQQTRQKKMYRIVVLLGIIVVLVCIVFAKSYLRRRSESFVCGNTMVAITPAARMWANDPNERWPSDLMTMSHELNSSRILQCPGEHAQRMVRSWTITTRAIAATKFSPLI